MASNENQVANSVKVSCPTCDSTDCLDLLAVAGLPVTVGALFSTQEQALKATKGDLRLAFCKECSYVWNRGYEQGKHDYLPGYEISLHFSSSYQEFLEKLAARLIEKYGLQSKTILEIACGSGHFLRMLCALGENRGIGIDPVLDRAGKEMLGATEISFIREKFSERFVNLQCHFICCRQALHAVPNPKELTQLVRRLIGPRDVPIYFEVVNADVLFKKRSVWQLMYEYYSFFTPASLKRLFSLCEFDVHEVQACYVDGQYLQIEAVPMAGFPTESSASCAHESVRETLESAQTFASGFREKIAFWEDQLARIQKAGKRTLAWGAGGRGINFLNLVQASRSVPYIVDINPNRCGGYVPGTGQRVVAPEFLYEYRPDVVLLTNPTYEHEVRKQLENMGLRCDFLVAS